MLGSLWGGKRKRHGWCGDPVKLSSGVGDPAPRDWTIPPFRILGPDHLFPSRNPLLPRKSVLPPITLIRIFTPSQYSRVSSQSTFVSALTLSPHSGCKLNSPWRGRPAVLITDAFSRHVLVSVAFGSQQSSAVGARVAVKVD